MVRKTLYAIITKKDQASSKQLAQVISLNTHEPMRSYDSSLVEKHRAERLNNFPRSTQDMGTKFPKSRLIPKPVLIDGEMRWPAVLEPWCLQRSKGFLPMGFGVYKKIIPRCPWSWQDKANPPVCVHVACTLLALDIFIYLCIFFWLSIPDKLVKVDIFNINWYWFGAPEHIFLNENWQGSPFWLLLQHSGKHRSAP